MIPEAQKVQRAYEVILKNPDAIVSQLAYLEVFPKDKDVFITIFNPDDNKQLYKVSNEHLEMLNTIGKNLPDSVIRISLGIAKRIKWSKGPVDQLQHIILTTATANPEAFVDEIYLLKRKDRDAVVAFMADVEADCREYNTLLATLQKVGAHNIAGALTRAHVQTH